MKTPVFGIVALVGLWSILSTLSTPNPVPILPNPKLTPGDRLAVTAMDVCSHSYSLRSRNVTASEKRKVFVLYGMTPTKHPDMEVDHATSLCLGGSNSLKNLWPQPMHLNVNGFDLGAVTKDLAENATHKAVCEDRITLAEAQRQEMADWRVLYVRFVSPSFPKYQATHR